MICAGRISDFEGRGDLYEVESAVVTETKLSVDWQESGETGHLHATSSDGVNYGGNYGYPRSDPLRIASLKRYDSKNGEILFIGTWHNKNYGQEGTWFFTLKPTD